MGKTFIKEELIEALEKLSDSCDSGNIDGRITGSNIGDFHWKCGNANAVNFISSKLGLREPPAATDTNVGSKPDKPAVAEIPVTDKPSKPRLAEILGVEVGKRFKIGTFPEEVYISETGNLVSTGSGAIMSQWLTDAINHPESIIRKPRLTAEEAAIFKWLRGFGAKWVSRDSHGAIKNKVSFWNQRPLATDYQNYYGDSICKIVCCLPAEAVPSLRPGDCLEVTRDGEL